LGETPQYHEIGVKPDALDAAYPSRRLHFTARDPPMLRVGMR
jgi:hypothetical protein